MIVVGAALHCSKECRWRTGSARRYRDAHPNQRTNESRESVIGYGAAHAHVARTKGRAGDKTCRCGAPAHAWAYMYGCPGEQPARPRKNGRQDDGIYCVHPEHYTPLCRPCHWAVDYLHRVRTVWAQDDVDLLLTTGRLKHVHTVGRTPTPTGDPQPEGRTKW